MALEQLRCSTIGDLNNGTAGVVIDKLLQDCFDDLEDRGGEDKAARIVTIKIAVKKVGDSDVATVIQASLMTPPMRTGATIGRLRVRKNSTHHDVMFETQNSESPDQPTLLDESE